MNSAHPNSAPLGSSETQVEGRLTAALEHKPQVSVPDDFAARVAARAVAQPVRRRRPQAHFGSLVAVISVFVSAVALFVLAPYSAPSLRNPGFDLELALIVEVGLIGCWMARNLSSRSVR